jgi:hypothetical protein
MAVEQTALLQAVPAEKQVERLVVAARLSHW